MAQKNSIQIGRFLKLLCCAIFLKIWIIFPWAFFKRKITHFWLGYFSLGHFSKKKRPIFFLGDFSLGLFSKKYRPTFLGYFFGKITQLFFGRFFRKNHPNFLTNFFGKITQKFFKKRKNCPEYRATLSLHNPLRIWRLVRGLSFLYGERNLQFSCFARSTLRT